MHPIKFIIFYFKPMYRPKYSNRPTTKYLTTEIEIFG